MAVRYTDDAVIAAVRERVELSVADLAELDAAMGALTPEHTVRTVGGIMLADALRDEHPEVAREIDALIEGRSAFSDTGLAAAVHVYVLAAWRLEPERSLREVSNDLIERAILANRQVPFVQIILRATGGRWEEFLAGLGSWNALVSSETTEFHVDLEGRCMEAINRGPSALAMTYFEVGFSRALMGLFEREGEHRYVEREPGYTQLEVRW